MVLKTLEYDLSVCKAASLADIAMESDFFFIGKTDEEISLKKRELWASFGDPAGAGLYHHKIIMTERR